MNLNFTISIVCLVGVHPVACSATTQELILAPGGRLEQEEVVSNSSGECELVLRSDGNLVVEKAGRTTWSSENFNAPHFRTSSSSDGPFHLRLQRGGTLMVRNGRGESIFSTHTRNTRLDGDGGGGLFFNNDDCSVTIKANNDRQDDVWTNVRSTFRSGDHLERGEMIRYPPHGLHDDDGNSRRTLLIQNDGNLIMFEGEDRSSCGRRPDDLLWGAGVTSDVDRFFLKFTCDGRLVLKEVVGKESVPYWTTRIAPRERGESNSTNRTTQGYSLVLQDSSSSYPFGFDSIDGGCE